MALCTLGTLSAIVDEILMAVADGWGYAVSDGQRRHVSVVPAWCAAHSTGRPLSCIGATFETSYDRIRGI